MKKNKKRKKNNNQKKLLILSIIIVLIILVLLIFFSIYKIKPNISKYIYSDKYNEDKTINVTLKLNTYNNDKVYCKFVSGEESKWILARDKKCTYGIKNGDYIIKIKYDNDRIAEYKKTFNINRVLSVKINENRKYIAVGGSFNIRAEIEYIGKVDTSIKYSSSSPEIVSIDENGQLTAHSDGKTIIRAKSSNGLEDRIEIIATSLIRPRRLDNNKQVVGCNVYSKEQVDMLDDILKSEVERAGPGTRAGVVAAATFLPLEFPYKIPYFYENGRLTEYGVRIVDGEGRWYHKGLYLGKDKENEVTQSFSGPSSWGCPLLNWEDDGYRKPGVYYPNGFDCSGYISWILYNGGLDPGDYGSGISGSAPDLTDLGEVKYITYDLMHSGTVKPGDLIGWDGHVALIAWMTDTKIYVTESLLPGVVLDEYDYASPYSRFYSRYDHIVDMSSQYSGEGNYPIIID